MKLNEKSLAQFASSGAPPDKEGLLHKRGDFNRSFQKRWCILKGNLLFYYDKRGDKEPLGMITLEGCTIQLCDQEDGFMIQFPGCSESKTRTYILKADTQEDMEEWMRVLSCASYDYMRACVNELKSQLEDATSNQQLVGKAVQDRDSLRSSMASWQMDTLNPGTSAGSKNSVVSRRQNPFDNGDSSMDEMEENIGSEIHARTFQEMHEEYRQQIKEIMDHWKQQQRYSMVVRQQVVA